MGTGPNAMMPFSWIGVGVLGAILLGPTYVPLVEPWSATIMRSSITVACWLETLGCAITSDARAGSRPMTRWPGGACCEPCAISISVIAGWFSGTWAGPTVNCVRKSNGTCSPGWRGLPAAVAPGEPTMNTSFPPPW